MTAAARLGVDVVVGFEHRQALAGPMGDRAVVVPLAGGDAVLDAIAALHDRTPLDAVLAVDDQGVVVVAWRPSVSGCATIRPTRSPPPGTRPPFGSAWPLPRSPSPPTESSLMAPTSPRRRPRSGIRAWSSPSHGRPARASSGSTTRVQAAAAGIRIRAIVGDGPVPLLVERFVPGAEVAVEGLLLGGRLEVLAVFDKPDPMDGPFFEETIYVAPSWTRLGPRRPRGHRRPGRRSIGVAGRTGARRAADRHCRCAHDSRARRSLHRRLVRGALRFGAGVSLEEVIIRHALGLGLDGLARETQASGVMMLPIRSAWVLDRVSGQERALAIDGVVGVEISIASGRPVVPLPEGDRYLGFVFARGPTAQDVEDALRRAEACLEVRLR